MAPAQSHSLSAQDLAELEGIGSSNTGTIDHQRSPHAPRNPYNPFTSSAAHETDEMGQLVAIPSLGQAQGQAKATGATIAGIDPPLASGLEAAAMTATDRRGEHSNAMSAPSPGGADDKRTWAAKDVIFRGQNRKIIMQNENGPCSLLAIANILLLRGDVALQPPDRPIVTYEYLSSLIAEYLLTRPAAIGGSTSARIDGSLAPVGSGIDGDALTNALSLLPQTQHGLNLNPSFRSNEAFDVQDQKGHLELFELLGIKLYHGFLPDPSSSASYELLTRAGSYDAAMDLVVRGDDVATDFFANGMRERGSALGLKELASRGGMAVVESSGWGSPEQRNTLSQAFEISSFLNSNSSQLSYPGLFALSALPEGTLAAFFRFNHLSVLYRPRKQDLPPSTDPSGGQAAVPALLTLVTDDAFADDELAIWESLADIDGSDSGEMYDGRFRKRQGTAVAAGPQRSSSIAQSGGPQDADYALALQLHSEERDRVEQRRRRSRARHGDQYGQPNFGQSEPGSSRDPTAPAQGSQVTHDRQRAKSGGLLNGLGLGRKTSKRHATNGTNPAQSAASGSEANGSTEAPTTTAIAAARAGAASDLGAGSAHSAVNGKQKGKKDCAIM